MGLTYPYNLSNGTTADADEVMANFNEIKNNFDFDTLDDASANAAAMQAMTDPYPASAVSLATDGTGELKRLRYQVEQLLSYLSSAITYWYEDIPTQSSISVHRNGSNQNVDTATWTKIEFTTEVFDTNSDYDNSTNYRFTPTVAGKYIITAAVNYVGLVDGNDVIIAVYKNGTVHKQVRWEVGSTTEVPSRPITAIVDANGSTDYFEIFTYHNAGVTEAVYGAATDTWFMAGRVM